MTRFEDQRLLRRLRGPSDSRTGGGEVAAAGVPPDPELDRLERLWADLEPPPAEPAPPGFSSRVMARLRERQAGGGPLARRFGVVPARLAAASVLSAGLVAGAGLGALIVPAPEPEVTVVAAGGEIPGATLGAGTMDAPATSTAGWSVEETESAAVAAAVEAAGEPTGEPPPPISETLDGALLADPELADAYLAALIALGEAS